jgi:hypothetical protein
MWNVSITNQPFNDVCMNHILYGRKTFHFRRRNVNWAAVSNVMMRICPIYFENLLTL